MYRMGEFFSGPGGMALGARWAAQDLQEMGHDVRIVHEWANDYDEDTADTYEANIRPNQFYRGDVRDEARVPIGELTPIQGFAFGFPCNDFSSAGENKGLEGEFGPLYEKGIEVLDTYNPKWFVAENVTGLLSANSDRALTTIMNAMRNAGKYGYKLVPHVYRFEEYGVPQKRRRIIIVGIRGNLPYEFKVPAPPTQDEPLSVQEAFEKIAPDALHHEMPIHRGAVRERLELIAPGENAFNAERLQDPRNAHLRLKVKGATLSNIYRRLRPDEPSYTVTGSGGGGTHIYHWDAPRALTNRERATLQTFPQNFRFSGGPSSIRKQVGMAVPAEGARAIFRALFLTFEGVKYDHEKASLGRRTDEFSSFSKAKATV
ncbi:DNA cytosine methyltransferase [Nesterenkonia populi]|uniref:DNA cytosine methyltransferase n=1 Tax=Nesterenkonia populi TaxID=1591087 RepID=UPI001FEC888F|nr:DNA (cytosine-5-)-methyltransferase [Nesterenkonia populi]